MRTELHNYDLFPKVFLVGETARMTLKPLGLHAAFSGEYTVRIQSLAHGSPGTYPDRHNQTDIPVTTSADGCLRFECVFPEESEYYIRVIRDDRRVLQMSAYALAADMRGRLPFRGDLHMHTFRSDGRQAPAIVAANYRRHGYDFFAITDHGRYYSSLEAIDAYKDVPHEFNIVPGEEIHLPGNDIHMVGFGANYSINGLLDCSAQTRESSRRAIIGNPPPVLTQAEYEAEVNALIPKLNIPDGIEKFTYASCVWVFERVRAGGGLGIFAHPYWISDVFQVPESLTDYLAETHPFDAYEVLGGENYYQQNGFQTVKYYEDRAKGRDYPVVGSTDSHNSIATDNRNALICSTFVFAKANERTALVDAVKGRYSVAVDSISPDIRLVGDFRLVKYTRFIIEEFTPLHDELCFEDGRLMKAYATGDARAAEALRFIHGRMAALYAKYFAV